MRLALLYNKPSRFLAIFPLIALRGNSGAALVIVSPPASPRGGYTEKCACGMSRLCPVFLFPVSWLSSTFRC